MDELPLGCTVCFHQWCQEPGWLRRLDSSFRGQHRLGNFTLCSLFWHETDDKTYMWAFLNYILLRNGFSPLEIQFLQFSHDTCSNTSPPPKANEVPRSHWLLVKHSLKYLNPFGRVSISHVDVFRMTPLHLLRLHYPCARQGAKAISTLCSPPHFLKTPVDTMDQPCYARAVSTGPGCVRQEEKKIQFPADWQENPCLQSFIEAEKKWENAAIFNTRNTSYFFLTLPSIYSG